MTNAVAKTVPLSLRSLKPWGTTIVGIHLDHAGGVLKEYDLKDTALKLLFRFFGGLFTGTFWVILGIYRSHLMAEGSNPKPKRFQGCTLRWYLWDLGSFGRTLGGDICRYQGHSTV